MIGLIAKIFDSALVLKRVHLLELKRSRRLSTYLVGKGGNMSVPGGLISEPDGLCNHRQTTRQGGPNVMQL